MKLPARTSLHPLPDISGYTILEQLYLGVHTAVYRGVQMNSQLPVVIKVMRQEYPNCDELVQFCNQYTIAKNLPIPGIVQPLSLEPMGSGYALVMEDCGGTALGKYAQQQSLNLTEVLEIALQITDILHDLCQYRVVHKDIKPDNLLIHPESKQIKLIDFSIASLFARHTQDVPIPKTLEGTLAYMAPEQTGRMNCGIDHRTDFYALGVTLYQLLSGKLPFVCDDPLELMHCHLAKVPIPVNQVNPDVPTMVAAIVSKLMAKNAQERYQSAMGLKHDVQKCLTQWQAWGAIANFTLGEQDLSDRFLIPEKLYGRTAEVQSLLAAFDRTAAGSAEFLLIAGLSGLGKTAVVNQVQKPIVRQQGYFIQGKFEQFHRHIPLSGFVQALRDLMGQLLSESHTQLARWQTEILAVVGDNGQVLIELIPELEQIIGKQPPVPELSGNELQNRFNLLLQKFIAVFTTAEHPLVLFLDDLQWADWASLELIKLLIKNNRYLLILGAYRDNEVSPQHPLRLMVGQLHTAKTIVNTITLKPLAVSDTNHLVADTLNCALELAKPLSEFINRQTQGNPFFTIQLLKTLYEDGKISFDRHHRAWQWDITQVSKLCRNHDVVAFMGQQLQKLPENTQQALKLAACIGNQFDLATLAIACQQSPINVATALWKALQVGLIVTTNQGSRFFCSQESEQFQAENTINLTYRFFHDRIQQAAYSLIPPEQKANIHHHIGQLLWNHFSSSIPEQEIFTIVGHLNLGSGLIVDSTQRIDLARLNLLAGRKAMSANAYSAALKYLTQGINLLADDAWSENYALTLELHHTRLDVAYLNTKFEELEVWGEIVLQHTTSVLDRIKVYETRMMALRSQGRFLAVVEIGLQVLKLLGIEFPPQPQAGDIAAAYEKSRQMWQGRDPLSLLDLPTMQDPQILATMQILTKLVPSAHVAVPSLLPLLICQQVELSIEYGNCAISIFSYADYGLILCGVMGDISTGYKFGQLALALLEQLQVTQFQSRAYFVVNSFSRHWQEPLHHTIPWLLAGYRSGLESGDWECVALNLLTCSHYQYWAGRELQGLAQDMVTYREVIEQVKQAATLISHEVYLQTVLNLLGESPVPYRLQGRVFDANQVIPRLQDANDRVGLFHIYLNQALLCYLFGQDEAAVQFFILLEEYSDAACGYFLMAIGIFYDALIHLRRYPQLLPQEQALILERIASHQAKLQAWAIHAPFNHQHRWQLVAAEQYRVLGQMTEAMKYYDLAIATAKTNGYLQEAALANELAAKFYLDWGKENIAQGYLTDAYYKYAHWGAKAKIQDLESRYRRLLMPILQQPDPPLSATETVLVAESGSVIPIPGNQSLSSVSNGISASLDLATVLKASQTFSSEIQLERLLAKLLYTVLENAGADKGVLLMPREQQWFVEAVATVDQPARVASIPFYSSQEIPHNLIDTVQHNLQPVVIADVTVHPTLATHAYVVQQQPKSILCTPILQQGKLVAILYLENHVTIGAFVGDRIELLNFLCAQAAISLQNARLYQQSQNYAHQLEQSLEKLRVSEARFQKLANNVPGLIYQFRLQADGTISIPYVSSGCQTLYEVAAEDLITGKYSLRTFEHPDDQPGVSQATLQSAQNLTPFHHEWRIITRNGSMKWVKALAQPERTEDGATLWDGMLIDITNRKQIEAEQRRLLAILENTSDFIGTADPTGKILYLNRAWRKLLNLEDAEVLTRGDISQNHPAWAVEIIANQALPAAVQSGIWVGETALLDASGQEFPISQVVLAHKSSNGEVEYFSTMARDISDVHNELRLRKLAEAALIQKSQELTQALQNLQATQLQMVQSEKMASLGNLVAGVAHEINNPIGFLKGSINNAKDYVQDLLEHLALYQEHYPDAADPVQDHAAEIDLEFLQEDLPKLLETMTGASDRIKSISNSLRTFSRADHEYKVNANLHEGINSTLLILKYRLKGNEHRPAIQVMQKYGQIPPIECFPGQLNQVFMNILANAIDVFDEAAGQAAFADLQANPQIIIIQTTRSDENAVEIRITDNGKGMSQEVKTRVFDHLFTTKGVGKGTGLGLAIAHQIVVEKHGGTIEVQSELGQGTEFCIRLPICAN